MQRKSQIYKIRYFSIVKGAVLILCYENDLLENFGEWLKVCEAIFCFAGWYNCSLWLLLTSLWMHKRKFTNKAQFDAGFSERLKLKDNAVPTILDPTVMLHHTSVSNCFITWFTNALSVITDCLMYWVFMCFNLNHSSVHLWKTAKLLANHSSGCLLLSLQSTKPIQTERSDEGVKTGQKIAYPKLCLDNIISGHRRTVKK